MKFLVVAVSLLTFLLVAALSIYGYNQHEKHRAFVAEASLTSGALESMMVQMYGDGESFASANAEAEKQVMEVLRSAETGGEVSFAIAAQHELNAIQAEHNEAVEQESSPAKQRKSNQTTTDKRIEDCLTDLQVWSQTGGGSLRCSDSGR